MREARDKKILLVYDRGCPVCEFYCRRVWIPKFTGELEIVDARERSVVMDEITAAGLDIDQGIVLKIDDRLYYGSDAIHVLALISSRSGLFNRINAAVFRSRRLSGVLYPALRFFRNLLLKILRKPKVNNLCLENNRRF